MKTKRIVFFSLFGLSALISVVMLCSLFLNCLHSAMLIYWVVGLVCIAVQAVWLILVKRNSHCVVVDIATVAAGLATVLSGRLAFATNMRTGPLLFFDIITVVCLVASYILCVAYCILALLSFYSKSNTSAPVTKTTRVVFFSMFGLSALISALMLYNTLSQGAHPLQLTAALIYIAVQLAGLVCVLINRNRVVMAIAIAATGLATILSGRIAATGFISSGAGFLNAVSYASHIVPSFLFIGYVALAWRYLPKREAFENQKAPSMKVSRILFFCFFGVSAFVSAVMLYNMYPFHRTLSALPMALICVAVQVTGLVCVLLNRNRMVMSIAAGATGVATALNGMTAFASFAVPGSSVMGTVSLLCMFASMLLLVGYVILAWRFLPRGEEKA